MPKTPIFSVICPVYNSEAYLMRTLASLLSQTCKNYEVIFADDGSTDNSVEILEQHKAEFLSQGIQIQILKGEHSGPGATRNHAIRSAKADWLAFLDADDEWLPHKLERVEQFIELHPTINFFNHWTIWQRLNGLSQLEQNGTQLMQAKSFLKQLFCYNGIATSASVVKRSLVEDAGYFDASFPIAQDLELWLRIGKKMQFMTIPEVLGYYHEVKGSIGLKPYRLRFLSHLRIYKRHWRLVGMATAGYMAFRKLINRGWFK